MLKSPERRETGRERLVFGAIRRAEQRRGFTHSLLLSLKSPERRETGRERLVIISIRQASFLEANAKLCTHRVASCERDLLERRCCRRSGLNEDNAPSIRVSKRACVQTIKSATPGSSAHSARDCHRLRHAKRRRTIIVLAPRARRPRKRRRRRCQINGVADCRTVVRC